MNARTLVSVLAALALTQGAAAQQQKKKAASSETKVQIEDVKPKTNTAEQQGEQDTDEVITNRKLRAETGSKSKGLSVSMGLGYNGGSVQQPGARIRPNIRAGAGERALSTFGGDIGMKYRLSPVSNIGLQVGVRAVTPFHDPMNTLYDRVFVDDPNVDYSRVYRALGMQNVSSVGLVAITNDFDTAAGALGGLSLSQTAIYDFGGSKFSMGLSLGLSGTYYQLDASKTFNYRGRTLSAGDQQSDYSIGVYPFMEYVINDTFNLRTLVGQIWQHTRSQPDGLTFLRNNLYQSVGLGISVTRDIFLYPNIQFIPENIRADETNVAISANINLF